MSSRSKQITNANCTDFYQRDGDGTLVGDDQMCYGNSLYIVPNTCQFDVGAPIERKYNSLENRFFSYQMGIHTHSKDCGFGFPAVYTKVSRHLDWIDTVIFGEVSQQGGGTSSDSCPLPTGQRGTCKKSSQCLEIVNRVKRGEVDLRDYICDFTNHQDPEICCPLPEAEYNFASECYKEFILDESHNDLFFRLSFGP